MFHRRDGVLSMMGDGTSATDHVFFLNFGWIWPQQLLPHAEGRNSNSPAFLFNVFFLSTLPWSPALCSLFGQILPSLQNSCPALSGLYLTSCVFPWIIFFLLWVSAVITLVYIELRRSFMVQGSIYDLICTSSQCLILICVGSSLVFMLSLAWL